MTLNRQQQSLAAQHLNSDGRKIRRSRDGGHMELRPADIHEIDRAWDDAERFRESYGIEVVVMDPEIYDAVAVA